MLEKKYGLTPAEKRNRIESKEFKKVDTAKGDMKMQVGSVVKDVLKRYHFQSFNEYRALLSLYNISAEEVKGCESHGQIKAPYYGIVYSATDDMGEKVGNPFNASVYGKSVGYKALQDKFDNSKEHIRDNSLARETQAKVRATLHRSGDRDSFVDKLKAQNIDVIFRENNAGRLYGATYIDHNNQTVFNGSRLGKELSANAITDWFENPQVAEPNTQLGQSNQQSQEQEENQEPEFSQKQDSYDDNFSLGGLFDLGFEKGGDDPEEERFRRAMQRKKKRKGRRM